jgi:hypothetical protein
MQSNIVEIEAYTRKMIIKLKYVHCFAVFCEVSDKLNGKSSTPLYTIDELLITLCERMSVRQDSYFVSNETHCCLGNRGQIL